MNLFSSLVIMWAVIPCQKTSYFTNFYNVLEPHQFNNMLNSHNRLLDLVLFISCADITVCRNNHFLVHEDAHQPPLLITIYYFIPLPMFVIMFVKPIRNLYDAMTPPLLIGHFENIAVHHFYSIFMKRLPHQNFRYQTKESPYPVWFTVEIRRSIKLENLSGKLELLLLHRIEQNWYQEIYCFDIYIKLNEPFPHFDKGYPGRCSSFFDRGRAWLVYLAMLVYSYSYTTI